MFGLNPYAILGGLLGYALAAALGWLAWHEHGVAVAQAARDRASIAQVEARATASALAQQQAIDAQQQIAAEARRKAVGAAVNWLAQYKGVTAKAAQKRIETVRRASSTGCAAQPIPKAILDELRP